jgi:hypothetical protein
MFASADEIYNPVQTKIKSDIRSGKALHLPFGLVSPILECEGAPGEPVSSAPSEVEKEECIGYGNPT